MMNKQFDLILNELYAIKNLLIALNQAHKYCYDNNHDSYHLHTITDYSINNINNLINDFSNQQN